MKKNKGHKAYKPVNRAKPEVSVERLIHLADAENMIKEAQMNVANAEGMLLDTIQRMQGAADYGSNPGVIRDLNVLRQIKKLLRKAESQTYAGWSSVLSAKDAELQR